jgi:hypothetical protein
MALGLFPRALAGHRLADWQGEVTDQSGHAADGSNPVVDPRCF